MTKSGATTNWLMPIAGILMALFVGWQLKASIIDDLLKQLPNDYIRWIFIWTVRIVAPIAVLLVMLNTIINFTSS